jgi:oligopeptide transport system substrate-binding protein
MSLRTRRGLALGLSLMFLAAACTSTPAASPSPTTAGAPTTAPGTPGGGATTAPGTPGGPTTAPGTVAPTQPGGGNLAADQTLRLYLSSDDPTTLDPNAAEDTVSISVIGALHRGLLYYDDELGPVPSLATDLPEVSDEGRTLTFTLRDDAVYSDGSPIVAGDLLYSWRRLVTPSLANPYRYVMCFVEGADQLIVDCGAVDEDADDSLVEETLGVEAPDEHTFVVHLSNPATFFTSVVAMWITVPLKQEWVESNPFDEAGNYLSSGPFLLDTWQHNSLIRLTPNPTWYGDPATVTVDYNIGGDPDAAMASYEQGNLDMVPVPPTQRRRVIEDPSFADQLQRLPQLSITYYGFATCQQPPEACPPSDATSDGRSPASNLNFRIAFSQAVDKERLIEVAFGGTGQVANSIVMPGLRGYDPDFNPYPFDLVSANEHLNTAIEELGIQDNNGDGFVSPADLGRITIGYNSNAGHLPIVTFLAEAWRTGLTTPPEGTTDAEGNALDAWPSTARFQEDQFDFVGVDFSTFLQQRTQGTYDVSRNGWGADFPHAHNQLSDLFRCNGGNNDEQWCDPEFDRLVDEGAANPDPDAQEQNYIEAQRIMLQDAPIIPMRFGEGVYVVQPYLSGVRPTSSDHTNYGDNFLESIQILEH